MKMKSKSSRQGEVAAPDDVDLTCDSSTIVILGDASHELTRGRSRVVGAVRDRRGQSPRHTVRGPNWISSMALQV